MIQPAASALPRQIKSKAMPIHLFLNKSVCHSIELYHFSVNISGLYPPPCIRWFCLLSMRSNGTWSTCVTRYKYSLCNTLKHEPLHRVKTLQAKTLCAKLLHSINDVLYERIHFSSIHLANFVPPQPDHNELNFETDKLCLVMVSKCYRKCTENSLMLPVHCHFSI